MHILWYNFIFDFSDHFLCLTHYLTQAKPKTKTTYGPITIHITGDDKLKEHKLITLHTALTFQYMKFVHHFRLHLSPYTKRCRHYHHWLLPESIHYYNFLLRSLQMLKESCCSDNGQELNKNLKAHSHNITF